MEKWIDTVGDNFKPVKHSVICSDHFTSKDYEIRPGAYKPRLKKYAVPICHNNNDDTSSMKRLKECTVSIGCNNNDDGSFVEILENVLLEIKTENYPNIEHSQEVQLLLHVYIIHFNNTCY